MGIRQRGRGSPFVYSTFLILHLPAKGNRLNEPCCAEESDAQMDKEIPGWAARSQEIWIERFHYGKRTHSAGNEESEEWLAFHFKIFAQPYGLQLGARRRRL
jgi:hypothetical protein